MQNEKESHHPKLARLIARINTFASSINPNESTSNIILDPMFPYWEVCSDDSENTIFGRQFGIPYKISNEIGFYE